MHAPIRIRARLAALTAAGMLAMGSATASVAIAAPIVFQPAVADYVHVSSDPAPPTEAQCFSIGRRCFTPAGFQAAYNLAPLYTAGWDGSGITVAIVDSFGSDTMAHDLHVFNQAFNLPSMCGEEGVTCQAGMPTFKTFSFQGSPATKPQPGKGTGQEDKTAWSVEVALDVESVHSFAPGANILLVTTPTAETLGVQGYPLMMKAEQYVVDHHMADVISQSFGAAEESFHGGTAALLNLRDAYKAAAADDVTVLASTGDNGSANIIKTPVHVGGTLIPFPTVGWPASDPLVTAVGGTYLCTDPGASTRVLDNVDPPVNCQGQSQTEIGWIDAGGGFSHVFSKPSYQDTLPAGSTAIGSMRGIPDVASESSSRTGPLVYDSLAGGWFIVGGTSVACPEWAGMVAIAAQINGGGLGLINPALYKIGADSTRYANDFFDVTTGNNQAFASVPGYPATTGWDPVTGLGTANAANLLPDLVSAVHGN